MPRPRTAAALALAASPLLIAAGCMEPGWKGKGTVIELEYMKPEREGRTIDHDGLEITVLTDNGQERSVMVEDCDPGQIILSDTVTVEDVTARCGELHHSTDE